MAAHPSLQGRGLASTLLGRVFEEIRTRAAAAAAASPPPSVPRPTLTKGHQKRIYCTEISLGNDEGEVGKGKGKGKVMLMLSTMLELNESYHLKRGFVSTAVRRFEKGTVGSRDGFGVVEMMRWVEL